MMPRPCPQDIAYPTDIRLLAKSREITEAIIDELHATNPQGKKPRTYRKVARKRYLKVTQNKNPSRKVIRKGIKFQLQYLKRNFKTIEKQLDTFAVFPLTHRMQQKYWIIQTLYAQQLAMFEAGSHQVEHRIVSIDQPHVRPIVRGKARSKTEFGAKIHLSLVDGFSFLDTISWDAFNEGSHMRWLCGKLQKALRFLSCKSTGRPNLLHQRKQEMAEGQKYSVSGQTLRPSIRKGSGIPRKTPREEPD